MFQLQLCPLYTASPALALYNSHFPPTAYISCTNLDTADSQLLLNIDTYIPIYKASRDLHSSGILCSNELNSKREQERHPYSFCVNGSITHINLIMIHYSLPLVCLATSYVLWSAVSQSASNTNGYTSQLTYHTTINLLHKILTSTLDIKNLHVFVSTFSNYWNWCTEKH
jgi:hypothetical protein